MIRYTTAAINDGKTGLTLAQVRAAAPSVFSTRAHSKMSERYTFISTAKLIEPLLENGFQIASARQRAVSARDPKYTRHELRLRPTMVKPMVGDTFPEVIIQNSHDGQSRLGLAGGLFRLVCSNGMVTGIASMFICERHTGDREKMLEAAYAIVKRTSSLSPIVERMAKIVLNDKQMAAFAIAAAQAAYGEDLSFDPQLLLAPRREADQRPTLWNVFNRVQENTIRGGVTFNNERRQVTTRGITHIGRSNQLNIELWNIAEKMAA